MERRIMEDFEKILHPMNAGYSLWYVMEWK